MKIFDKSRIEAKSIYDQVYKFVSEKFAQSGKVFSISSAYGQIIYVLSQLTEMILFYIEDSITELNMQTASRTDSIQGLARLAGHDATRAIASTGEISFTISKIPDIQGDQVIVPNFSRIQCENNGKVYTLNLIDDQVRLRIGEKKTVSAQIVQGEIFSQVFTGDGEALQSYTATTRGNVLIDNFFIKVYVNGELWKKYDSIYDIPYEGKGFLVKTGITGGLDLYFGNTYFGKSPQLGSEIRVEYLQTNGEGGNVREGEDVTFKWIDSGYSLEGQEIDLNDHLSTSMSKLITFGSNPEPTALTRLIAPKTSRSYVLANPDNYIVFLEKFNYFSVVDAYTTFGDQYLDDDNVIYLFLIPDITKRLQNTENYFTVPLKFFSLTSQEEQKVLDTIEDSGSKVVTTVVKIVDPTIVKYVLNVSLVVFEGYSQDVIKSNIISNLSSYFLSVRRRDLIPSSDLVRIIENVEGVDSVNVSFLSELNEISKKANPSAAIIGLDDMGDIVIGKNELPVIRGGWKDRNGISYDDGIFDDKPGSVNINIKRVSKKTTNTLLFQENMNKIMNNK
jgi:hypothetical protein